MRLSQKIPHLLAGLALLLQPAVAFAQEAVADARTWFDSLILGTGGVLAVAVVGAMGLGVLLLGQKYKDAKWFGLLARAQSVAGLVIHDVEAKYRAKLTEANADGVVTEAERSAAKKDAAMEAMRSLLANSGLGKLFGGASETVLSGAIERALDQRGPQNP